jgi:hypothetical protein
MGARRADRFIDRTDFLAYFNSVNTQADTYQLRGGLNGASPTNAGRRVHSTRTSPAPNCR